MSARGASIPPASAGGGGHYEIDHLIPLGLGGADVAANLWPESFDTEPWNAAVKDQLEDFLHADVCAGRIPIEHAQREIAEDWIAAYQRYLGEPSPAPSSRDVATHADFPGASYGAIPIRLAASAAVFPAASRMARSA